MVEIYEMTPVTCFADQVYGSSVNSPVRHKCLSVIGKLMYFSSADMIQSLNNITNISRYEYQQNISLKFFIRCGSGGEWFIHGTIFYVHHISLVVKLVVHL